MTTDSNSLSSEQRQSRTNDSKTSNEANNSIIKCAKIESQRPAGLTGMYWHRLSIVPKSLTQLATTSTVADHELENCEAGHRGGLLVRSSSYDPAGSAHLNDGR